MSQVNPVIAQGIWEYCRPFSLPDSVRATSAEFVHTYNFVCNRQADKKVDDPDNLSRVFDKTMLRELDRELRKLLIVLHMRSMHSSIRGNADQKKHLNFTFAPTECEYFSFGDLLSLLQCKCILSLTLHCIIIDSLQSLHRKGINDQPCMLIQTGHFYIQDMNLLRKSSSSNNEYVNLSLENLVVEITAQEYNAGKGSNYPDNYVCACEVAFDSKGQPSCNLSMWVTLSLLVNHLSDF
jgi:hypothetical protein